jgi:import inner membrane translocase subunit TIM44
LDLRDVEIAALKVLPDSELPVVVLRFTTQEVIMFRNKITKEIALGKEDNIEMCVYAAVFTRDEALEAVNGASKESEDEESEIKSEDDTTSSEESSERKTNEEIKKKDTPKVNPVTGGWRLIEMAKHDARPTW